MTGVSSMFHLQERLYLRTSDLISWAKTMLPVINQSVRDAPAQ
jgi:hypothetical protein